MIDKICNKLIDRMKLKMPDMTDEKAEVIRYGLELLIGEVPKFFILFAISLILGIFKYTLILMLVITPYKMQSGGVHLKTHIGCITGTTLFYCGNVLLSKYVNITGFTNRLIFAISVFIFAIIMITVYAPADTENVPILRKKDRRKKKILSYVFATAMLICSFFIKDTIISNMLIFGVLIQSIMISGFAYKIFNTKFGYLEYIKTPKDAI